MESIEVLLPRVGATTTSSRMHTIERRVRPPRSSLRWALVPCSGEPATGQSATRVREVEGRERGSRGGAHSGRPAGRDTDEDETKWAIWQLGPQAKCASARLAFRLASGPAHLHLPADLPSPDDRFVPSSRPSPSPYSLAHATVQQRRRGARPNPPPFAEAEDALPDQLPPGRALSRLEFFLS